MRKASERERENRDRLFRLMQEHPELPIAPMVNDEVVCDDTFGYWHGSLGASFLSAYVMGDEGIYIRNDSSDEMEDVLNNTVGGRDWYTDATEDEIVNAYSKLPWTECILVYIELPEPD